MPQQELFYVEATQIGPPGFNYKPDFLTPEEERKLVQEFKKLTFKPYQFGGYKAKRQTKSYTKRTGYPEFLKPIILRAAKFANVSPQSIEHAMVTEYTPGTPIGWHRDQPPYNKVIGISFGSEVPFRFRRKDGDKWRRITVPAKPRSIYVMSGPSRYDWQHSIPPVENLRYSITMRTVE